MKMSTALKKIDYHIAIWGLIGIALSAFVADGNAVMGTAAGALVGMLNWYAFRKLVYKAAVSGDQMTLGLLVASKFAVLVGVVVAILLLSPLHPVAFTAGISSLFLGISTYFFTYVLRLNTPTTGGED